MSRSIVAISAMSCALVAGCTSTAALPPPFPHSAALGRGTLGAATLEVGSGATTVNIRAGNLTGELVAASTPPASGQRPVLTAAAGGVVNLRLASIGSAGGPSLVDVVLDRSVVWTIDLDGGATAESVDMRGGRTAAIDLAAGASTETIELPARSGTQVIRETGGASVLTVGVPASVAARVEASGGAGSVTIGATTHTGVAGGTTYRDPGYATAADRVDLQLQGGVSKVRVVKH